jgi:hypothetical protein
MPNLYKHGRCAAMEEFWEWEGCRMVDFFSQTNATVMENILEDQD